MIRRLREATFEIGVIGILILGGIRLNNLSVDIENLTVSISRNKDIIQNFTVLENNIRSKNEFLRSLNFGNKAFCTDFGEAYIKVLFEDTRNFAKLYLRFNGEKIWGKPRIARYFVEGGKFIVKVQSLSGEDETYLVSRFELENNLVKSFYSVNRKYTVENCQ